MTTEVPQSAVPDEDWLRLDQQICFSLHAASRAFNGVYRVVLKDLGLTYPQYLVMLVLWEEGELPVKKLGEHLRLDSGTLSPLLKRLEAAGLLRRERDPKDQRNLALALTDKGRALRAEAEKIPAGIVARLGMPIEELMTLQKALGRVIEASQRALATSDAPEETVA
jgi:DNA-binding MarR family transcriptional regulator